MPQDMMNKEVCVGDTVVTLGRGKKHFVKATVQRLAGKSAWVEYFDKWYRYSTHVEVMHDFRLYSDMVVVESAPKKPIMEAVVIPSIPAIPDG